MRGSSSASILAGLLWCLAVLAVVVVGTLHSAHLDLRIGKNHGDLIQAHYLAVAGAETAKALLFHDAMDRRNIGRNHTGELYDAPLHFRDVSLGRGRFRVVRQGHPEEYMDIAYGVSDEEARINVNTASSDMLVNLEGIDLEIAASVLAFREQRSVFRTVQELLLVRNVSPVLLLGEPAGPHTLPNDALRREEGLSPVLTVYSSVRNVNAAGEERIDIQNADESSLMTVPGITSEIASAIVSHRGENQFETLADLLDVRAPTGDGGEESGDGEGQPSSQNNSGPSVINQELLMSIADHLTVNQDEELNGLVNINTAGVTVLSCLPGIDRELAYAIVSHRRSDGFFENTAELLRVPRMNGDILGEVLPHITARSETYRIVSEGTIESTGARRRIQMVVRVGASDLETLYYKEDT